MSRLSAILILGVAACAPWDEETEVTLSARPAPASATAPSATVESGQEFVRVHGVIAVPDRCRELTADVTRNEGDVGLWVLYGPAEEACAPGEFNLAYTAEIEGLSPGRYELRVIHGRSGVWRGTEPVLVHPIVVRRP